MHCGCNGVCCLCSFLDRRIPTSTDTLQNPLRNTLDHLNKIPPKHENY